MKKSFICLIALLVFVTSTLLTGCDDAPQTPYIPAPDSATPSKDATNNSEEPNSFVTIETTEPDDGRAIPFSKMKEDMSAREEIQNFYTSDFVTESAYVVTDIELEKEQVSSDGKQTVSYSNIIAENEFFSATLYVRSVYNFYDYGGWIMDDFSIEQINTVSPLRVPDENAVMSKIKNSYSIYSTDKYDNFLYFDGEQSTVTIESSELSDNTARFYLLVGNPVMTLDCYMQFDYSEEGWTETGCYTNSVQYDYSVALGSFQGSYHLEALSRGIDAKGSIQIDSISNVKAIINIDYCTRNYDGRITDIAPGQGIECEFIPGTATIKFPCESDWNTCNFVYDPFLDSWAFVPFGLDLERTEN